MTEARQLLATVALEFWRKCSATYVYGQHRPYPSGLYAPEARDSLDCSATAILIYRQAGQPDPNGTAYNGTGWTGSLIQRGEPVDLSRIEPGDLIFYGDPWGSTGHVTTSVGDGECVSFGSTPISVHLNEYRPIVAIRRYPVIANKEPVGALPFDGSLRLMVQGNDKAPWAGWAECSGPLRWIAEHGLEREPQAGKRHWITWRSGEWLGATAVANVAKHLVHEFLEKE